MHSLSRRAVAGAILTLALTGAVAGCGDDAGSATKATPTPHDMAGMNHTPGPDEATAATSPGDAASEPRTPEEKVDRAFVRQMTPHHLAAVLMATSAVERAQRPKLKRFAARIVQDQSKELATLQRLGEPLGVASGTSADDKTMNEDVATLGVSMKAMSMSMEMLGSEAEQFKGVSTRAFDTAFLDAMIEHHEGAVAMAKAELERGSSQEIKELATQIERAQEDELETMRAWKRHW